VHVDEYSRYDLTGLAELLTAGEVAVSEVHHAARIAIEQVDAEINAVADGPWPTPLSYDPGGPFAGAPFVVKDLVCHPRDVPMRLGSRMSGKGLTAPHDTHLMARFRAAGLATIALATTPELGISPTAEAAVYGPTRNPWDPTRSPGGSSGGSSALVAARAVPTAHANDSAGSIRIPAAACGLVGLKPSRGRVPIGPDAQEIVFGQMSELAVTRTVRDTAAILDAVTGWAPGEHVRLAAQDRPFRDEVETPSGRLRVAVHTDSWAGSPVDPDVRDTVERVAMKLGELGHHVEEATPRIAWDALVEGQVTIFSAATTQAVTGIAQASGLPPDESTLEQVTLAFHEQGQRLSALDLAEALASRNDMSQELGSFFIRHDVLVTPTLTTPAWPLGRFDQNETGVDPETWLRRAFDTCSFTPLASITGTPAVTLPLGTSREGLPIGVQLAVDMGHEATLLRLAGQLETVMPWRDRLPPLCARTANDPRKEA
jgi:amidase